ncbi:Transposable element Tcb1 transposase, partial [Stegodyphus mimosarum]
MVWGAIACDSRSPLVRIQGTMTAQRCLDNLLRPMAIPYLQELPNAIFQQHNARPRNDRICQHALQGIQMLPWPPCSPDLSPIEPVWDVIGRHLQTLSCIQMLPWPLYSPDLSPIEHVWDVIGRRLQTLPLPRSEDELWQMVERKCRAIPQDTIRTLIDSMPRRVSSCIAVRGGPTSY